MLSIRDITYDLGARRLFDRASLHLNRGEKAALVGRNGYGKSTLFDFILGSRSPQLGEIELHPKIRFTHLEQHIGETGEQTVLDYVLAADKERGELLAQLEIDPADADAHDRLNQIDGHSAPARAARILAGLGFTEEMQGSLLSTFSGGWRMRVALAACLFAPSDLLLLDEPTNHLDLETTLWVEEYLREYRGTLLLISHDRRLLNNVPNVTFHLTNQKFYRYAGGYDSFERQWREKQSHQAAARSKQLEERRHMEDFVNRFRAKASKARQAQSRLKMLERMEPIADVMNEGTYRFNFPQPERMSPPLITFDDVSVGYGEKTILHGLNLRLDEDDRIALLGPNGQGKSTLLKLVADKIKLKTGSISKSPKLKVGYFAQHQAEELNLSLGLLEYTQGLMPMATEEKCRSHLGRFGFGGDKVDLKIKQLSGGERARLLLAMMCRDNPHLLIFDEPTNHLDIDSRQALAQAINSFEGAVMMVSHDPHLLELCADQLWLVSKGTVKPYEGDLTDYTNQILALEKTAPARARAQQSQGRKEQRQAAAASRAEMAPLRKEYQQLEREITKQTSAVKALEAKLHDPELYTSATPAELIKLKQHEQTERLHLASLEARWLELAELLG